MKRRDFIILIGGSAATWSLAARAQQPDRMRHIGVLLGLAEDDPDIKARLAAFRQGLEKRGWSEGRNVRIDYRFAPAGTQAQILAKELVALQPEVMLAQGTLLVATLRQESLGIPIVFVGTADPIFARFIASMARPGGNLTGLMLYESSVTGKWLAMLKEMMPQLARVALLVNPKTAPYSDFYLRAAEAVAPSLAIDLVFSPAENAADIERTIESFARTPNGGLLLLPDTSNTVHRALIAALAVRHRLPTIFDNRVFAAAGGLMSYGVLMVDLYRQAAYYIDRILRGDKPADLPVQAPTRFETVLNLKTAKALGLTVPPGLLVAADEVIE
jgi:putative ABC transport system substrate-binding protein